MNKLLALALAGTAALIAAAPAAATLQTTDAQVINFGTNPTEYNPDTTDYSTQSFNLFDPTQYDNGTLVGVIISDQYSESQVITLKGGTQTATGSAKSTSTLYMLLGDQNQQALLNTLIDPNGNTVTGTSYCFGNKPFPAPQTCTNAALAVGETRVVNSNSTTGTLGGTYNSETGDQSLANDLASFVVNGGTTTGSILAYTSTDTTNTVSGGNFTTTQKTQGTPVFTIQYLYEAATVPEPATWAMMIAGFGMVGYGMRRKGTALRFS